MSKAKRSTKSKGKGKTTSRKKSGSPKVRRRTSSKSSSSFTIPDEPLLFGRQNYLLMGVGILLIALGILLMSGGSMPDYDTWEPERIYSFTRITLAPLLIIAGFIVEIVAIFKK